MVGTLTNAVKYTEQGEVRLTARGTVEEGKAGQVLQLVVAVNDTGIGIKPEDIDKLFTKFQRVDLGPVYGCDASTAP